MKRKIWLMVLISLLSAGCSKMPVPVEIGVDECALCKMIISDEKFASEIVTSKGKIYKFDSIECMLHFEFPGEKDSGDFYVTDISQPGVFINAKDAFFLISNELKSPMGENISAFEKQEMQVKFREQFSGEMINWLQLNEKLK